MSSQHAISHDPPAAGRLFEALKQTQRSRGWVSRQDMVELAAELGLSLGQVYGVASFYSFIGRVPSGRHVIHLCNSLSCLLGGARLVLETLEDHLGLLPGRTTADGRFSLALASCIGACDQAPAMLVDGRPYGCLTPGRIIDLLRTFD